MTLREYVYKKLRDQGQAMFLFDDHLKEDVYCAVTLADIMKVLEELEVHCGNCCHWVDDSEYMDGYKIYEAWICELGQDPESVTDLRKFFCNSWDGPVRHESDDLLDIR